MPNEPPIKMIFSGVGTVTPPTTDQQPKPEDERLEEHNG